MSKSLNRSFYIDKVKIENPIISAPMAGVTCSPFRLMVRNYGASLVCTEMVSCEALIRNNEKTVKIVHIEPEEKPVSLQLFGGSPERMAEAANLLSESGASIIDINMGCPAPKVLKTCAGSSLILDHERAINIFKRVFDSVNVPVTVKIRSDYYQNDGLGILLAKKLVEAGASAISLHPRSVAQKFSGKADWKKIRELKEALSVPVIGSGDIFEWTDVVSMLEQTGTDGVMIARGALGNPWIFSQSLAAIHQKKIPDPPSPAKRIGAARKFYTEIVSFYGEPKGVNIGKKHLLWFLKGLAKSHVIKEQIIKLKTYSEIDSILNNIEDSCHIEVFE